MKGQLTLSLGKMKKGDDVDDDHDGAVRTGVSQDRVTAILCTEELFLGIQYIALSLHIRQVKMWGEGGYGWST